MVKYSNQVNHTFAKKKMSPSNADHMKFNHQYNQQSRIDEI